MCGVDCTVPLTLQAPGFNVALKCTAPDALSVALIEPGPQETSPGMLTDTFENRMVVALIALAGQGRTATIELQPVAPVAEKPVIEPFPEAVVFPVKVEVQASVTPFAVREVGPLAVKWVLGGLSLKAAAWVAKPNVAAPRAAMAMMDFMTFLPVCGLSDAGGRHGRSGGIPQLFLAAPW